MILDALGETIIYTPWRSPAQSIEALVEFKAETVESGGDRSVRTERLEVEILQSDVATITTQKDEITVNSIDWVLVEQANGNGEMRHLIFERATRKSATGRGRKDV